MGDDFARAVEFVDALGEISERNQVAAEIADLIFVRLANVEDVQIIATIKTGLQIRAA